MTPKGGSFEMRDATKKVILRLKAVRNQKGLTYQDIVDACETQNESISLSTVKRFFAKGSEDGPDYRVYTVNAIFHAVVGTEEMAFTAAEEAALTETEKEIVSENAVLKAVVELKDASIEDMQHQIDNLTEQKANLESQINAMQIRLDATLDLFRLAMESIGKTSHSDNCRTTVP